MSFETVNVVPVTLLLSAVIRVRYGFVALHRWAACPFPEQAFLKDWHRHRFGVAAVFPVSHHDRDLEFFRMQEVLKALCEPWQGKQVEMSCEMFATALAQALLEMGFPVQSVTVDEDGENEAQVIVRQCPLPTTQITVDVPEDVAALLQGPQQH